MTKTRNLLLAVVLALALLFSIPLPVQAISVPDSGPFIIQVDMYRHLLEDNDLLVHIRYNWPYDVGPPDTTPSETIAQSAFVRLLNGTTELATSTIYPYKRRGWGYGSASMYLNAASATGLWSGNLTIELQGSPTLTWTGGSIPQVSTTTPNWYASTSQSAARLTAYSHLITWAGTLGDYWNITLVQTQAGGNKLSSYGETYFTNAIPNLRLLVPELFSAYVETPQYTDIEWTETGANVTAGAWPFNFGGISQYFGMPSSDTALRSLLAFVIIATLAGVMISRGVPVPHVTLASFGLLIALAVPGFISLVLVGGVVFVLVLLTGMVFLLRRA